MNFSERSELSRTIKKWHRIEGFSLFRFGLALNATRVRN